jgi:hypothetical protein
MKYDYVGVGLLKIAALLYAARYVAAALFMGPGLKNWDSSLFAASYKYVGSELTVVACVSAIAGIAMLALAATRRRNA